MAKVTGVKEKLHMPLYDAFMVKPNNTFRGSMDDPRMIRFFVDIQNRTKLETNLQASGVLPESEPIRGARAARGDVGTRANSHRRDARLREPDPFGADLQLRHDASGRRKK